MALGVLLVFCALEAAAPRGRLQAQTAENDTTAIALLLLPHVRSTLPAGPAALDPEPFCAPRLVGWRCPGAVRALADRLGLALNSREFTLVCLAGRCRLVNVVSLVDIDRVEIDSRAGRASVLVDVWRRDGQRTNVLIQQRTSVSFTRARGQWRVDR